MKIQELIDESNRLSKELLREEIFRDVNELIRAKADAEEAWRKRNGRADS